MFKISLRHVYYIFIVASIAMVMGRIAVIEDFRAIDLEEYRFQQAVNRKVAIWKEMGLSNAEIESKRIAYLEEVMPKLQTRRPTLSANDRSRWALIRALVEPDMRVPGAPYAIDKVIAQRGWDTIDMVKHDGHLYSSKPPLLPTLQAGIYWLVVNTTGMTCAEYPFECVRTVTALSHIPCLLILFIMTILTVEKLTANPFARAFIVGSVCFGTYLTTYAVSLQNHLPAAAVVSVALYAIVIIVFEYKFNDNPRFIWFYFLAGLFSAFAVVCELPALAFFAALALVCVVVDWKRALTGFLPGCLIVAAGYFGTNYAAHNTVVPPYAHRKAGDNWYDYTYDRGDGVIRDSYWKHRVGVDRGEPSRIVYAFNVLVGHHGIFSLTPLWAFSVAGAVVWLLNWKSDPKLGLLGFFILSMTVVVIGFYIMRPLVDRNYGGITCAFRWSFWLIPLWLTSLIPIAERANGNKWITAGLYAALFWSILAASTALINPWTHPWIFV